MAAPAAEAASGSRKAVWATSSTRCSENSWAVAAARAAAAPAPAPTCGHRSRSGWPRAYTGTKVDLRIPTRVACDACAGTGSASKQAERDNCSTCGGSGKVRAQQGFFLVERSCPTCGGMGRVVRNPCRVCSGAGTVPRDRTLSVSIPAGVEDGVRIRLAGEGEAGGAGAPAGDLYVHVAIKPHDIFQRDGANIYCRVPLRMTQAAPRWRRGGAGDRRQPGQGEDHPRHAVR